MKITKEKYPNLFKAMFMMDESYEPYDNPVRKKPIAYIINEKAYKEDQGEKFPDPDKANHLFGLLTDAELKRCVLGDEDPNAENEMDKIQEEILLNNNLLKPKLFRSCMGIFESYYATAWEIET